MSIAAAARLLALAIRRTPPAAETSNQPLSVGNMELARSRPVTAQNTSANDAMLTEMRQVKAEIVALRETSAASAASAKRTSDLLARVTRDGESLLTTAA